jgi:hypothetical protein
MTHATKKLYWTDGRINYDMDLANPRTIMVFMKISGVL